ncbi:OmpP1/FadL family transporter [Pseudomonas sp. RL_5y_Pfl2_73]|uniref:OmpP1/FadL family transporter n=1 Tax=Pseudomonas sp. RL_5y_Pfl2_73 TaxID=3088713 RepID=UPI0030D8FD44
MIKIKIKTKTMLGIVATLASSPLFAGGFAINETSVSAMGTGYAGRSSSAIDASTVQTNPAGMSRLKNEQVSAGVAVIDAKTDTSDTRSTFGGKEGGDVVPIGLAPMGYYVKPIDEHWAVGFGVYVPFGLITDYGSDFAGRYFANKSKVEIITFQPTVSYAFNDKVSIGFGPTINRVAGELSSQVPNIVTPGSNDGKIKVNGTDTALGFNAGVLIQATDSTRLGLTYHSKVSYRLEGDTKVSGGTFSLLNVSGQHYNAELELDTPESVDFSLTHKLNDDWTVYAGSTWTRWSRFKEVTVESSGVSPSLGGSLDAVTEEQNWHDTWAHAIGAAYQLNKEWVLRTGLSVDQSPTDNAHRSARFPTGDRRAISFGAGWTPVSNLTIDFAYSYLKEETVKVSAVSASSGVYNSTYSNSGSGFATSLTYRF